MPSNRVLLLSFAIGVALATLPFFGPFPTYLESTSASQPESFGSPILFGRMFLTVTGLLICVVVTLLWGKRVL
ncbi:hypothetical protein SAMN05216388_101588 [Halorientalis persicus]|jgi:hypothetical protein|uniref:Uncharacterized protein n=1 Tax=Halorientalis persicus TaxID=1367881 RepID=A0A1H8R560_9EURY|nr:hypothetical protein SAMN05216388_101588 [Halorientalis persicus]